MCLAKDRRNIVARESEQHLASSTHLCATECQRSLSATNVPIAVESTQEPEVQLVMFFCFWEVFATETPTSMRQNVSYGLGLDLGNFYLGQDSLGLFLKNEYWCIS